MNVETKDGIGVVVDCWDERVETVTGSAGGRAVVPPEYPITRVDATCFLIIPRGHDYHSGNFTERADWHEALQGLCREVFLGSLAFTPDEWNFRCWPLECSTSALDVVGVEIVITSAPGDLPVYGAISGDLGV